MTSGSVVIKIVESTLSTAPAAYGRDQRRDYAPIVVLPLITFLPEDSDHSTGAMREAGERISLVTDTLVLELWD